MNYSTKSFPFQPETKESTGKRPATDQEIDALLADLDLEGGGDGIEEVIAALSEVDDRSNEVTGTPGDWSNKVTEPADKPLSNKVTARKRRSDKKDRETLQRLRDFKLPDGEDVAPSFSKNLERPISPLSGDSIPSPTPLPMWEFTDDRMKLVSATVALQAWGDAVSFTFNIPDKERAAFAAHPKSFIRSVSLAFNRATQRRLGYVPLYWLSADITKHGRLHLHGAVACPTGDIDRLREVMIEAWGKWKGRGKEHQIDINLQRCDDGWVDYALRSRAKVRAVIGDHTFIVAKELRRRARFIHGELREIVR